MLDHQSKWLGVNNGNGSKYLIIDGACELACLRHTYGGLSQKFVLSASD